MPSALRATALALGLLAAAPPGAAQDRPPDRPSEEELFGAPGPTGPGAQPPVNAPPAAAAEPPPPAPPTAPGAKAERADPLAIGGLLYLRADVLGREDQPPSSWLLASPNLVDVYLDVRPNDRVRGFVLGRLLYDPTGVSTAVLPGLAGVPNAGTTTDVQGLLDQLWVNFDVARTVFVTAGKQHVKWGVGRFWNPTDYLHRVKRNPLAVFDARTGVTMVKAHLPWESRAWNLYGVALLEDVVPTGPTVNTLGAIGGAARAEVVLGTAELGLDAVAQRGTLPRYGVDVSAGVWDVDLYGEVALRTGPDVLRWREIPGAAAGLPEPLRWQPYQDGAAFQQVTAGASWSWKYGDEDVVTFGGEYFYNGVGYPTARAYTTLLAAQISPEYRAYQSAATGLAVPEAPYFTPYYLGRQYAGAFVLLPSPGSWNDTTLTLSVLANLTDGSAIARLDHAVLLNTYLRLETYVAGHVGKAGGEFRLAFPATSVAIPGSGATVDVPGLAPPTVDFGVALRVTL
jgi:hypothetical protein